MDVADRSDPLAEPRRIAFSGDWHQNADYACEAIAYARSEHADVVVHLGDFGYRFSRSFLQQVTAALTAAGMHLLFVDGNHEDFPRLLRREVGANGLRRLTDRVWHLPRGLRWRWAGVDFVALGGAHSVDRPYRQPGISWWAQERITDEQAAAVIAGGHADVLIAHDCPAGVHIPGLEPAMFQPRELQLAAEHRQVLRRVVNTVRPSWVWHGHYHRDYREQVDFGYGPVIVTGLDCDGADLTANVRVVDMTQLQARVMRFANPYLVCTHCRRPTIWRSRGNNLPCGHGADYVSLCPTWSPVDGCSCPAWNIDEIHA